MGLVRPVPGSFWETDLWAQHHRPPRSPVTHHYQLMIAGCLDRSRQGEVHVECWSMNVLSDDLRRHERRLAVVQQEEARLAEVLRVYDPAMDYRCP